VVTASSVTLTRGHFCYGEEEPGHVSFLNFVKLVRLFKFYNFIFPKYSVIMFVNFASIIFVHLVTHSFDLWHSVTLCV
jgi:hypothetical protein